MNSLFGKWASTLRKNWLLLLLSTVLPTFGLSYSALTAQRIYASYSTLERSVSVTALENFAKNGVVDEELAVYTQFLKPGQLQELRRTLLSPIKVDPVAVSQFLYTPQGEFLLRRLTEVIRTESRQPEAGFHALRAALILAAKEPEGLTLLNLVRKYPNSSIHIDLTRTLGIAAELQKMVNETNRAVAAVFQKSITETATIPASLNLSQLPDLRRQGRFVAKKMQLKYFDGAPGRGRLLLTDIYLPNTRTKVPVIVISHGLGTDSSNFQYLANYLASYGLAVVVPNHPGSDSKQLRSLLNGSASEIAQPEEFYNRPLDVKYILNQLEADSRLKNRLNLQQVGVFGQSLGGYTALALAGAKINFEQLNKDCNQQALKQNWNMSLLLQCRAVDLYGKDYNLRDERVKAVIAVNPITSSIFGETGLSKIKTPVMIVAGTDDTIAPALYEQIQPFSWINNSQKYLVLMAGGTHFSVIGETKNRQNQVALPSDLVGDNPTLARRYINTLSLPFLATYVGRMSKYSPYLNAAYARSISSQTMGLSLIQSLTPTELARATAK
ncbi:MAG: alpha/beta hydrolase [Fischerella sp.]|jgi:predicted dienelactone hydrolase|uniref:alpha/beta hydrolase n=1 Tax=Fischerella sp. TaxID=1191 RepID=UPI0017ACBA6C|nr:alpha/beta hydrolase [Fischerella sp.]NWF60433.1 alpha/beta hydrolase [Fischerella sp.]